MGAIQTARGTLTFWPNLLLRPGSSFANFLRMRVQHRMVLSKNSNLWFCAHPKNRGIALKGSRHPFSPYTRYTCFGNALHRHHLAFCASLARALGDPSVTDVAPALPFAEALALAAILPPPMPSQAACDVITRRSCCPHGQTQNPALGRVRYALSA